MLNAKLVVVGGDAKSAEVKLKLPTLIGRGKEASLTVPHALVSRRHTEIFERDGRLYAKDLGSLNGTYINNTRIEDEQPLDPNQLLTLGTITFRAVYEIASQADETGASDSEKVAFEQVVESVSQARGATGKAAAFDETVPIESPENAEKDEEAPTTSDKAKKAQFKTTDSENGASHDNHPHDSVDVIESSDETPSTSDTDKSFVAETKSDVGLGSSVLMFENDDVDSASRSISASAIGDLPAAQSSLSFGGQVDLGDEENPISKISSVDIELGDDQQSPKSATDSGLGSFLKKLPR